MLSVGIVTSGGVGYYLETVGSGVDDYYARTDPGRWIGAGASAIGLEGTVDATQIDALVEGCHPVTGTPLAVTVGKVAAFDLTFSAPKSVSLLAELSDPDVRGEVKSAHREAVAATLRFLEDERALLGRRGHAGAHHVDTVGASAAAFEHHTSRAGDPQLHTHLLVFNRAEGIDGRWGGLDGRRVFGWVKTAGYVYQAALRAELTERLGVEWRPLVNGTAEMAGFTDHHLEAFSNRRAQIEAALAEAGHSSAAAAQVATLATRPAKSDPVEPEAQRAEWQTRAERAGIDAGRLDGVVGRAEGGPPPPHHDAAALAADLARPHGLTEHRSSFDRRDVIRALAEFAPAGAHPHQLSAGADAVLADPAFTTTGAASRLAGPLYSTVELMAIEQDLVNSARSRHDAQIGVCPAAAVEAAIGERPRLSDEQQAMVRSICTSGRGIQVVVGRAGTGKTYALDAARAAWTDSGYPVIGTALAARTAAGLQAGTGIPSLTVDQLLADIGRSGPQGGLPRRSVLVVDEAGMVGTRKLAALVHAAEQANSSVVLVGDPRQLPEVDAGGAFAALAQNDPVELTVNRRQAESWERGALDQLRHGDVARAISVYRDRQRITLAPTAEAARHQLVTDWWAARSEKGADRVAMIALHQADVDDLNARARHLRQLEGELAGRTVEAAGGRSFSVGDEVMALRNDRRLGVHNGTRGTVTAVDPDQRSLTLETIDERQVAIPAGYLDDAHLTHAYAMTAHKAQGMTTGRAFVLGSDRLYREAGYTALSRAAERTDLYQVSPPPIRWQPAVDPHQDLARVLSRSAAQTLATQPEPAPDRAAIRDAALADPGTHLLDRLGPPPPASTSRDAWAAAATAIDTYRARYHIDGRDPLGPPPAEIEQRRQWDHAHAASQTLDQHLAVDQDRHLAL